MKKRSRKLRHASLPKDISTSTTDETSNIRKERVQNICVVIQNQGAYYLCSDIINDPNESMNGRWTANWTIKKSDKVVGAD